jgi:predicted DNA-binding transcriptional regulator YafY
LTQKAAGESVTPCLGKLHELNREVDSWLARGEDYGVVVDYTGGTKTMTAALVMYVRRWPCLLSHVGGTQRTKDGVGVVVSGKEVLLHTHNPWDSLGYQAVEDFVVLFDQHAYQPAAACVEVVIGRVSAPARKRELATLKSLADAYAAWDRFDHKQALKHLQAVQKNANDLRPLLRPKTYEVLLAQVARHVQHLETLLAAPEASLPMVLDLLSNAKRRAAEGRHDDAVGRLYRAVEALRPYREPFARESQEFRRGVTRDLTNPVCIMGMNQLAAPRCAQAVQSGTMTDNPGGWGEFSRLPQRTGDFMTQLTCGRKGCLQTPPPLSTDQRLEYAHILSRCCLNRSEAPMAEQLPLVRQWILLRSLCARHHGATVKELVQEMDVSEKTIRRDLETFQTAGFPLKESVGRFGRKTWHIDADNHVPGLGFAFDEAIALYLGRRFLEPLAGTVFWEAAQRAFKKIRSTLGLAALKYIDQFGAIFHQTTVGAGDYAKKADLIDELMVGIEDRKAVFITYQSLRATEPVTYDIYPYGLIYHRGALYLVGRKPQDDEICHWKVGRIEEAEVTQVRFQRPEDFDLQQHLAGSFGVYHGEGDVCIKVHFSKDVARYVSEAKWHESQKLLPQKDGSLVAEFQLSDTEEIKRWIMSFGRHAMVLEPEELRRDVLEEVQVLMAS